MYNHDDLLDLLAYFGRELTDAPAILPAFNNYYQDITGGQSTLGNLTLLDGERMFHPAEPDPEYPDFEFTWSVNGTVVTDKPNPKVIDIKPFCDGVVKLRLTIFHKPTGVGFSREEWAYFDFLDTESCPPDPEAPPRFGVFYTFYPPNVNVYEEYAYHKWDLNGDGRVSTGDLAILLQNYQEN